jgi:hypothetical protein
MPEAIKPLYENDIYSLSINGIFSLFSGERKKCLTNDLHEQVRHRSVSSLVYREGIYVIFI